MRLPQGAASGSVAWTSQPAPLGPGPETSVNEVFTAADGGCLRP